MNRLNLAVVGLGKMGESLIHHIAKTNLRLSIVVEIDVEKGKRVLEKTTFKHEFARTAEEAERIVERGHTVLTDNFDLVMDLRDVDVVVDATGNVDAGAKIAWKCINKRKHVVMLNAELDATVGPILSKMSDGAGIVYTGDIGDEPGTIMHYLYRPLTEIGLDVLVAGKGKNNPLDVHANPSTVYESSVKAKLNPKILTSFVDGTKTMVEMTVLSNATGMVPDVRGMHGPTIGLHEITKTFMLKRDGGILERFHVVDYVIGIAPGVFAVATSDDEVILDNLRYLKVGEGPNFLFYRPYHLPGSETVLTAKMAAVDGKPVIKAIGYNSETVTFAKRNLHAGEKLDGIGGYTCYSLIERRKNAAEQGLLPIGLAESAVLKRSVRKDEPILIDDVEIPDNFVYHLWKLQQKIF